MRSDHRKLWRAPSLEGSNLKIQGHEQRFFSLRLRKKRVSRVRLFFLPILIHFRALYKREKRGPLHIFSFPFAAASQPFNMKKGGI